MENIKTFSAATSINILSNVLDYSIADMMQLETTVERKMKISIDLLDFENEMYYSIWWNTKSDRVSTEDYNQIKAQYDDLKENRRAMKLWKIYLARKEDHAERIIAQKEQQKLNEARKALGYYDFAPRF